MTTTEEFWKHNLVILNISVWLKRLWISLPVCSCMFEVSLPKSLAVYVSSATAATPVSLIYSIPAHFFSFSRNSRSSTVLAFQESAANNNNHTSTYRAPKIQQHKVLKFHLVKLSQSFYQKTNLTTRPSPQTFVTLLVPYLSSSSRE